MNWRAESDSCATLFDRCGGRKYISQAERSRLLAVCARHDPETSTFVQLLIYSGCRISEALALTAGRLDYETGSVVFRTLKRRRLSFRAVPIPAYLMEELLLLAHGKRPEDPLWRWCRQTGWRRVKGLMTECGIAGAHATPKGLRHGFGILNAVQGVPMGLTQRWLGHSRMETTAIYQFAMGDEERSFAKRLWAQPEAAPTKGSKT